MKQKQPKVSVVMPAYNAGKFVAEAIESVVGQTYDNLELIVIDDASTDRDTRKVISRYVEKYPEIVKPVYLKKNRNCGGDKAAIEGIKRACGEYIARMDADDVMLPQRIEKQVQYLEKHPTVDVVGSSAVVIDRDGNEVGEKRVVASHKEIEQQFFTYHPMIHPTVMIRANLARNMYRLDYQANNDYLTFFTLITSGYKLANISEPLLKYRIHGENDSLARVKRNFTNSLKIRYRAVVEMGYRPGLFDVLRVLAQALVVYLLPEKLTIKLYLVLRGIVKPIELIQFPRGMSFARLRA